MTFSVSDSIKKINELLQEGPDNLIENAEKFSSHVEDLLFRAWLLTKEQANFLTYLVRLKAEVNSSANLILDTEKTLAKKKTAMSKLLEKTWEVQEAMIVHVFSLAAFFHEELTIDFQINSTEVENLYLKERKNELKSHIQESITEVLVKRRTNRILMQRRRSLNREILHLRHCMERTNEFRRSVEAWCAGAIEAGKNL
jgi:hypothetical protein